MNERQIERWLQAMPLKAPPVSLDERVASAAEAAGAADRAGRGRAALAASGRRPALRRIGWFYGVGGLAAGLMIGVLAWPLMTGGVGGDGAPGSGSGIADGRSAGRDAEAMSPTGGAAASARPRGLNRGAATEGAANSGLAEASNEPIEATVSTTQLVDEGVVVLDDGPARKIRRVTTRQMMYYDASSNERVEVTVPEEEVYFLASEPF